MGDDVRYDAAAPGAPGHPWRAARLLLAGFVVLVIAVAVLCIVEYITIHHMAGNLSLEELGSRFSDRDRRASSNYAIDSDGNVALYVEEKNRAWTSSDRENDERAITIEVANDEADGDWHVSDAAYDALVELCVDICKRNGIAEFTYTGDESGTLTTHRMFNPDTICPGPYLNGKLPTLAREVNARL